MPRSITIELSDEVAALAEKAGVWSPEIISGLLREELRRLAARQLADTMTKAHEANGPALNEEEIVQIVNDVKAERQTSRARSS